MSHPKRGVALIFNHEYFLRKDKTKRTGTEKDRDRLSEVLERLDFDVKTFDDLSFKEMMKELNEISSMNHTDNDCLLVTILTHGDFGTISSYDENYTMKKLVSFFTDENCPSLTGKPRIFFIQACRGNLLDPGHVSMISKNLVYRLNRASPKLGDHIDAIPSSDEEEEELEEDQVHYPPNHKDFLIVRSTMANHLSFRNTTEGSWFIQDLCKELETNGTTDDILTLLTHVNWSVSERESKGGAISKKKQILCISSMLTKLLKFNIKSALIKK